MYQGNADQFWYIGCTRGQLHRDAIGMGHEGQVPGGNIGKVYKVPDFNYLLGCCPDLSANQSVLFIPNFPQGAYMDSRHENKKRLQRRGVN